MGIKEVLAAAKDALTPAAAKEAAAKEAAEKEAADYAAKQAAAKAAAEKVAAKAAAEKAAAAAKAADDAKAIDELAKEVIRGDWGNGQERADKLAAAGHDYDAIQARVNEMLSGKPAAVKGDKTVEELAKEVIRGDWGNGQERADKLTAAGYDYNAVQAKVNELL